MGNLFFFRDRAGYAPEEKEERVKAEYVSLETPVIAGLIDSKGLDITHLDDPGKNKLLRFLDSETSEREYDELIDNLFRIYGEEGDSFNVRSYSLSQSIDAGELVAEATEFRDAGELPEEERQQFDYALEVSRVNGRVDQDYVDISFNVFGTQNSISSKKNMRAVTPDGDVINPQEAMNESVEMWIHDDDFVVEVRVYPDAKLMAVSNSDVNKGLQKQIRSAVQRWGKPEEEDG